MSFDLIPRHRGMYYKGVLKAFLGKAFVEMVKNVGFQSESHKRAAV